LIKVYIKFVSLKKIFKTSALRKLWDGKSG
jgi:hypothetical protein